MVLSTGIKKYFQRSINGTQLYLPIALRGELIINSPNLTTFDMSSAFSFDISLQVDVTLNATMEIYLLNDLANSPEVITQQPYKTYNIVNGFFHITTPTTVDTKVVTIDSSNAVTTEYAVIKFSYGSGTFAGGGFVVSGHVSY